MPPPRHMKLSDVEAQKQYLLPRTATFENAFPTVETMRVEIHPTGEGFKPFMGQKEVVEVYVNSGIPAIMNCRNPRCYGGGLDLGYAIRWSVVEAKLTEFEHHYSCQGYEGSPKGRKKYDECDTRFKVKISVKYKETANDPAPAAKTP